MGLRVFGGGSSDAPRKDRAEEIAGGWRFAQRPSFVKAIHDDDFESLTVGALSLADFRTATGDPTAGGGTRTYMSVSNAGGSHGKAITWTSPANTMGTSYGFVTTPTLPESFDHGYIEYDLRFREGFKWSGGGKLPGLGGHNSKIPDPPTGGAVSAHGWSSRLMWVADNVGGNLASNDELVPYVYFPYHEGGAYGQYVHADLNGGPVALGGDGVTSNGSWHTVRQVFKLNSAFVTDSSVDAATLVEGEDYLADGVHEFWVDGVLRYRKTDEVFRFYADVSINRLVWAQFRGGSESEPELWAANTEGYVDIANLKYGALSDFVTDSDVRPGDVIAKRYFVVPSGSSTFTPPTDATYADVHSSLTLTFTGPPTGRVRVRQFGSLTTGGTTGYWWNLRDANGDIAGTAMAAGYNTTGRFPYAVEQELEVTPGQTHTWKWGHARQSGTGSPNVQVAPHQPMIFEVMAI